VAVAALVGRVPRLAGVAAEGGATAARLVRPAWHPRVPGDECTSGCAAGRRSCQLCPPSLERIRLPSSIPTRSRSASCGLGAIQRTCDVRGRGGKLQCRREGSSRSGNDFVFEIVFHFTINANGDEPVFHNRVTGTCL
jgi:hypothetical protein